MYLEVNSFHICSIIVQNYQDIKPLEKQNVSNVNDFSEMFSGCSLLSDIKPIEKWDVSKSLLNNIR